MNIQRASAGVPRITVGDQTSIAVRTILIGVDAPTRAAGLNQAMPVPVDASALFTNNMTILADPGPRVGTEHLWPSAVGSSIPERRAP